MGEIVTLYVENLIQGSEFQQPKANFWHETDFDHGTFGTSHESRYSTHIHRGEGTLSEAPTYLETLNEESLLDEHSKQISKPALTKKI